MNASEFRLTYLTAEDGSRIVPVTVASLFRHSEKWRQNRHLKPGELIFLSGPEILEGMTNIRVFLLSDYSRNTVWQNEGYRQYLLSHSEKIYYASIGGSMTPWYPR